MDNVTSDLYLRIGGVTYNESGNYTCTADNGVDENTAATSVEVICKYRVDAVSSHLNFPHNFWVCLQLVKLST